jgi:hypothetical protein
MTSGRRADKYKVENVRSPESDCALCPITEGLCFWGEQAPYTLAKRRLLPFLSMVALALVVVVWSQPQQPTHWLVYVLSTILMAFGVTGLTSYLWGCNRCVVRLWGDVG